ncbi:MAG: hypothetical protein GY870_15480 [archaeon]|nr:hypothetical protein [archaeon]
MKTPDWLANRSTQNNIPVEIENFAKDNGISVFGDITAGFLKLYYTKNLGRVFFKLVRLLGFYGVIFYKKLSVYSGPIEDNPKVIFIPKEHRTKKLSACNLNSNINSRLNSCGIFSLNNLHGVPIENFYKLVGKSPNKSEDYLLFSPLKVVTIDKNFFYESYDSQNMIFDEYINRDFNTSESGIENNSSVCMNNKFEKHSINSLEFSVRPFNCFKNNNIISIEELIKKTDAELLSLPQFGRKSLSEVKSKLSLIGLSLKGHRIAIKDKPELDLNAKAILSKLNLKIKDIPMSHRSQNCLKNNNIEHIWQLINKTGGELLKIKNMGRKSFTEIKEIVFDLSFEFGQKFSMDEIKKITSYEDKIDATFIKTWPKRIAKELISDPLLFLTDKERFIVQNRIFAVKIKKNTLEEIAQIYNISRERIRQIEGKVFRKLRQRFRRELREVTNSLMKQLDHLGKVANLEDIEIDLLFMSSKEQEIVEKFIGLVIDNIFIDWNFSLISSEGADLIETLCDEIKSEIYKDYNEELFTIVQLAEAVEKISTKRRIYINRQYQNLTKKFLKKNKVTREGKYLSIGKIKKIEKLALIFKDLYPEGLKIYQKQNELLSQIKKHDPLMFRDATQRSVVARLTAHHSVLLWGRGFFVHEDNISFDISIIKAIILWILNHFDKGHYRFQIDAPYLKFKQKLISSGIPNQYALYTLLRKQEICRIGQRRYPTIFDLEANVNPDEGILEELEAFFKDQKKEILYPELKSRFVIKNGWKEYSLQQNICTHSELIFPWKNQSYIHVDYLNVSYLKLQELIRALREKLKSINGPYNLKGAKTEMSLLWEQTCPSATTRTISKLIRQADPEDLAIERNFIRLVDSSPESISTVGALEEFFLEKNDEINRHELNEEFLKNRGWTENQLYGAIRKAQLFQSGNNSYIHPTIIDWNEELSQKVYEVLSEFLKKRNANQQPHMQIEELIYEYVLPELSNGIEWTIQLLISAGKEFEDILFFDDAYVFIDNQFGIEDLDDMIGFLISKTFKLGIAQIKEVEKLLWREGIILNGRKIPQDQFFEDSSIYYSKSSDEVGLSKVGVKKYGYRR